jgi:hypothetical protein
MLQQVIDHGGPAQAARARELLAALRTGEGASAEVLAAAQALVDAFLHDPYLTRRTDDD